MNTQWFDYTFGSGVEKKNIIISFSTERISTMYIIYRYRYVYCNTRINISMNIYVGMYNDKYDIPRQDIFTMKY